MANTLKKLKKRYIPCTGSDSYAYFFFSTEDAKEAQTILSQLYQRKIKTYYSPEKTKGIKEAEEKQKLMNRASLAIVYLTANSARDASLKSDVLYLNSRHTPIIIIREDESVKILSTGLSENTPCVKDIDELVRADGFSYDLIDETAKPPVPPRIIPVVLAFALLAAAAAGTWLYIRNSRIEAERQAENTDPETVTSIEIQNFPDSIGELKKYPNLEKIIIPQSEAEKAVPYADEYVIVLK